MSSNDTTTSSSAILQLQLASQYLTFTLAFPTLISGVIGNLLNIFVFVTLGNYKHNTSSFYMLAKSFFDLNTILVGLVTQIAILSFRSPTFTSRIWCRLRIPFMYVNSLGSYTCLCLQSIDSFLCSSRRVTFHRQSTIRRAHYLVTGLLLVWICNESPYFFMQQLTPLGDAPNWRCQTTNTVYAQYRTYFTILCIFVIIPITTVTLFGYLTYRNIRTLSINERQKLSALTRQTTRMALFEIAIVLVFEAPYGIAQAYFVATANVAKNEYRQTQEQVANTFFFIYVYNVYASPFYCYCAASKRFRKQVLDVIKHWTTTRERNQVIPLHQISGIRAQQRIVQ